MKILFLLFFFTALQGMEYAEFRKNWSGSTDNADFSVVFTAANFEIAGVDRVHNILGFQDFLRSKEDEYSSLDILVNIGPRRASNEALFNVISLHQMMLSLSPQKEWVIRPAVAYNSNELFPVLHKKENMLFFNVDGSDVQKFSLELKDQENCLGELQYTTLCFLLSSC